MELNETKQPTAYVCTYYYYYLAKINNMNTETQLEYSIQSGAEISN
jgi:hypothetical protein